jgi:type IV pilus assembly protein PilX
MTHPTTPLRPCGSTDRCRTARKPAPQRAQRPAQRGISLMVSLVLLLVVTLVALGSLRGVAMQARLAGTSFDRSLAFQAAEAALREAERRAAASGVASVPGSGCSNGFCAQPTVTATPRWLDSAFTGWRDATAAAPAEAAAPQAIIEDMGDAPNWAGCEFEIPRQPNCSTRRFRISARSTADGRASVLVQSQMAAP